MGADEDAPGVSGRRKQPSLRTDQADAVPASGNDAAVSAARNSLGWRVGARGLAGLKRRPGKVFSRPARRLGVKRAFLDSAVPSDVSHAVRDVVERQGFLVSEHVSGRVRFRGVPRGARHEWTRMGYVGIFQRFGETEVEVRLLLRALWPWRILWTVAAVNVVAALATIVTNPPVNTWIFVAGVCGFALLVAGLLYLNTLRPVRDEERLLMEDLEEEFRRVLPAARLEDALTRADREAELVLEGEVTARRVALARKEEAPAPRSARKGFRFNLLPGRRAPPPTPPSDAPSNAPSEAPAEPEEGVEERRARLLARKAELEARRRGEKGP